MVLNLFIFSSIILIFILIFILILFFYSFLLKSNILLFVSLKEGLNYFIIFVLLLMLYFNFFFYATPSLYLFTGFWFSDSYYLINFLSPIVLILILITFLSIYTTLTYNVFENMYFFFYLIFIFCAGFGLLLTDSLSLFFIFYESLLLPSFIILYKFAKTRKAIEAAFLMFFWTQLGAFFILIVFLYLIINLNCWTFATLNTLILSPAELNLLTFFLIIGFGVKWPIWPFYGWLPKAHVEAPTNFSIFLSGVLVKFAFFGFIKILFNLALEPTILWIIPFLIFGLVDSLFKLIYQIDLKKLVAYTTVIEMHWLAIATLTGYSPLFVSALLMFVNHAIISSNAFFIVDCISRRFKTRLLTEISGLFYLTPKLYIVGLLNLLLFLGFPGSLSFLTELIFFTFLFDFNPIIAIFLLILIYLFTAIFLTRLWFLPLFNYPYLTNKFIPIDLTLRELLIIVFFIFISFWFGLIWPKLF